jgi:predicted glycoside hydrolase/deacetylase ChbG (UPF0249 family)
MLKDKKLRLIITADDYAAMRCIDIGIQQALSKHRLSCVSAFCTYPHFEQSITELLQVEQQIGRKIPVGVHLSLTTGYAQNKKLANLWSDNTLAPNLYTTLGQLFKKLNSIEWTLIYDEFRLQIDRLISLGRKPDHLTHHMNVCGLHPKLFVLLTQVAKEYELAVRSPLQMSRLKLSHQLKAPITQKALSEFAKALPSIAKNPKWLKSINQMRDMDALNRYLVKKGVKSPNYLMDLFYGKANTGFISETLMHCANNSTVELMVHPAEYFNTEMIPEGLDANYMPFRKQELSTLLSDKFQQEILNNVRFLYSFSDL